MAFHLFRNRGDEPRRTPFVSLRNSYHGETIGALSVGDIPLYRRVYAPLLLEPLFAPSPDAYAAREGQSAAACAEEAADALARLLDEHPRSEEHTSELQSLMRISYAVFCLTKKKKLTNIINTI